MTQDNPNRKEPKVTKIHLRPQMTWKWPEAYRNIFLQKLALLQNDPSLTQASADALRSCVRSSSSVHDLGQFARLPSKSVHVVDGPAKSPVHLCLLTGTNLGFWPNCDRKWLQSYREWPKMTRNNPQITRMWPIYDPNVKMNHQGTKYRSLKIRPEIWTNAGRKIFIGRWF